jgi:plastocyanin
MSARVLVALVALLAVRTAAAGVGTVKGTITSDTGPVADAVVLIEGPSVAASAGAPHAVVAQRRQTFVPRVIAVPLGTTVDFPNDDDILHNVFSASPAKKFDLGMYDRGQTRSVLFDVPGVVQIGCNVHPQMEAYVVVHTNPYVAVSDAKGGYTIAGVPDGTYQLRVWHERLAEQRSPVTVHDGQVEARDVRLASHP